VIEVALVGAAAALAAPHLLSLEHMAPLSAAAIWLGALALRAIVVVAVVLTTVATMPGSGLFDAIAGPTLSLPGHVELSGHQLAHALVMLPGALVLGALAWFCWSTTRAALRLRSQIGERAVGDGPFGSLVVADTALTVALPMFGPGRPIVSHAALAALDDAELEATIAHELGHLRRWHRPLRTLGSALAHVAFLLPGTTAAERGLRLSLERDADEYAVRTTARPLGLASGICKVARAQSTIASALALTEPVVTELRLEQLLAGGRERAGLGAERLVRLVAAAIFCACMVAGIATLTVLAPLSELAEGAALALRCAS
jgi:Zn-dependent protease with chaperone function